VPEVQHVARKDGRRVCAASACLTDRPGHVPGFCDETLIRFSLSVLELCTAAVLCRHDRNKPCKRKVNRVRSVCDLGWGRRVACERQEQATEGHRCRGQATLRKQRGILAVVALTVLDLWNAAPGSATPIITDGGFEGGFGAWAVFDQAGSAGTWFIDDSDGSTPASGFPTAGPATGVAYAVTDQTDDGAHVLLQPFTVPGAGTVILSFAMFVNDYDGGAYPPLPK
jgi:hypothetical protein